MRKFQEFCKERKYLVLFVTVMTAIVYGSRIFNRAITLDTDFFVNKPRFLYNWLELGRYGLVLTEEVFGIRWYNPYVNSMLCFCTMILFQLVFCFAFETISKEKNCNQYYAFCAVTITHQIWTSQWIFRLQNFEIAFSILLLGIALYQIFLWIDGGKFYWVISAVALLIWSFASYQSNLELFILLGATAILLYKENRIKEGFFVCLKVVLPFLAAFVLNQLIVKTFFSMGEYLTDQILWGKASTDVCIENITDFLEELLYQTQDYYYGVTWLVTLVVLLLFIMLNSNRLVQLSVWKWIAAFLVLTAPLLLAVVTGNITAYRSHYVLAFSCGIFFMFFTSSRMRKGILKRQKGLAEKARLAFCVVCFFLVLNQTQTTLRLWYTDDVRYEQDVDRLNRVVTRLEADGYHYEDYRMVFVGRMSEELNNSCYEKTDLIGMSYFDMFTDMEPKYLHSSLKICFLAQSRGIQFHEPATDDIAMATEIAAQMPVWPEKGCIRTEGNVMIIHLSEN